MQSGGGEISLNSAFGANSVVFVVRIWREKREDADAIATGVLGPCRGWVEHVATGVRHYFTTYAELTQHMQRYGACAMQDDAEAQPQSASSLPQLSLRDRLKRALVRKRNADRSDDG